MSLSVSIIVNNFNYASFLDQAIDSALNQTYRDVEVVVVDDGSTDDSQAIIRGYGDRITSVLKTNGGQASAMNAGFKVSSGQLILFLDADDYLFPDAVDVIASEWEDASNQYGAPKYVQVQSRLDLVDADGQRIDLYPAAEIAFDDGDVTPLLLAKGRYNTTITSGLGFAREALERAMPIPEEEFRISADGYLVSTVPFLGHVLTVETSVGARRKHESNAWAVSDMSQKVEQLGKSVEHDFARYEHLTQAAHDRGLSPRPSLEMFDAMHVEDRLMYARIGPGESIVRDNSAVMLSLRGLGAILKHSRLAASRKLLLCLWFLWLGLAPKAWVTTTVRWKLFGNTRPAWLDRLVKNLRRLSS